MRIKLSFLSVTLLLVLLTAIFIFLYDFKNCCPYSYKFIYSYNDGIYIYDIKDTTSPKKILNGDIRDAGWSNDGKTAYISEDRKLYYLNLGGKTTKLLQNNVDNFFWSNDNITLYATNSPQDEVTLSRKAVRVTINGYSQQISPNEYESKLVKQLENVVKPASFNGKFFTRSTYKSTDPKVFLINSSSKKSYPMPDGSFNVQVSPDGKLLSYKDNANNSEGKVNILFLHDALNKKFNKTLAKKGFFDYEWIDGEQMAFVTSKFYPNLLWDFAFGVYNVKNDSMRYFYKINKTNYGNADLVVSLDRKTIITTIHSKYYNSGNFIVSIDINSGKVLRKIPFDFGVWSNPFVDN